MVILVAAVLTAGWSVINHIGVTAATTPRVLIQALVAYSVMRSVSRPGLSVRRTEVPQMLRVTAIVCSLSDFMVSRRHVMVSSSHTSQVVVVRSTQARSHMVLPIVVVYNSWRVWPAKTVVLVVAGATPMVTRLLGVATPVLVVQTSGTTSVVEQGVTVVTIDVVSVAEELMAILSASTVVELATP